MGFYHEHQRPDRDNFVQFDPTKISANCLNAYRILPSGRHNKQSSDGKQTSSSNFFNQYSEYDHESVMHYGGSKKECMKDLRRNEPYMTLRSTGQSIPENKSLSRLDHLALKKYYEAPSKLLHLTFYSYLLDVKLTVKYFREFFDAYK